jgi:hypothetical protein
MRGIVACLPHGRRTDVRCPVGLFPRQEMEIARLTKMVNQALAAAERASWARGLALTTDVLLACEHYDGETADCRLCRNFSVLRRGGAALVARGEGSVSRLHARRGE